ncbi:hypothetical protein NL676_013111 [Syzygium grande]|nr:hypothetical protein NL676_013111 [Syzygium grande]
MKNSFKINIDGSFLGDAAKGAISRILVNEASTLLEGFARIVPVTSPLHIDLQALLHALDYFVDRRKDGIVIETDCLEIVKKLQDQREVGWEEAAFIREDISEWPNTQTLLWPIAIDP